MKHLTVVLLESTVSEPSLLYITLQFENLKGERFQTPADSIASNQITSVALCIQWREDSIFLGIVLSIPESLHHQGETYHNSRKFGSLSHWPSFLTVRHHGKRKVTNVSNKGRWFSKLSFHMYHVADIYLINPIVCVYSFPQPQIPETLPHNIHCPGPESLAFVGAVGSSLHLHRTLLVLCNEGLDVTMTSIPWKLSRVVYEGKLVTYTQCVFFWFDVYIPQFTSRDGEFRDSKMDAIFSKDPNRMRCVWMKDGYDSNHKRIQCHRRQLGGITGSIMFSHTTKSTFLAIIKKVAVCDQNQWLTFAVTTEIVPGTKTWTGIFKKQWMASQWLDDRMSWRRADTPNHLQTWSVISSRPNYPTWMFRST